MGSWASSLPGAADGVRGEITLVVAGASDDQISLTDDELRDAVQSLVTSGQTREGRRCRGVRAHRCPATTHLQRLALTRPHAAGPHAAGFTMRG